MTSSIQGLPQGNSQDCNKKTVKAGTKQDNLSPDSDLVNNQGNSLIERKIKFAKGFKIAAFAAGGTAAVTGVPAIIGAALATLTTITFLSHAAILGLGITAIALLITTIGLAIATTTNTESAKKEVSMDYILERWPKLALEAAEITKNLSEFVGCGGFGSVTKAFATFTQLTSQMAKEPHDHLKVRAIAKSDKNFDLETQKFTKQNTKDYVANEVLINYVLTQYITKNYNNIRENSDLKTCFRGIPLLILSAEQKNLLSKAQNYEELVDTIKNNIDEFGQIYLESKPNQDLDKHLSNVQNYSAVENLFKQSLIQLAFLNHLGIAHRDIKPQNMRINTDNNTVSLIDYGMSYLSLQAIENFYTENEIPSRTKQIYCAPPEVYQGENANNLPGPETENGFGAGALLLQMCLPEIGGVIINKFCNPKKKRELIEDDISKKFDEIRQDDFFKANFGSKKGKSKEGTNQGLEQALKFFRTKITKFDSQFFQNAMQAVEELKKKLNDELTQYLSNESAENINNAKDIRTLLSKIEEFEKVISAENQNFLESCKKNTTRDGRLNVLATDFNEMKIEGWNEIHKNLESIIQDPGQFSSKKNVKKNYTEENQERIIEMLKGLLDPDPKNRMTCEEALETYFGIELNFSDLPKLTAFNFFNT